MYSAPHKAKLATVGGRSTKNDDRAAHGKNPEDPTWTQTGAGLFVELRNGSRYFLSKGNAATFLTRYKNLTTVAERNSLVRELGEKM